MAAVVSVAHSGEFMEPLNQYVQPCRVPVSHAPSTKNLPDVASYDKSLQVYSENLCLQARRPNCSVTHRETTVAYKGTDVFGDTFQQRVNSYP